MTEAWLTRRRVEAITALLEQLRAERWSIGTSQIITVHELLVALHERADEPPSEASLAQWIGPIVCNSRQQQREFPLRLATVLGEKQSETPLEPKWASRHNRLGLASMVLGLLGILSNVFLLLAWLRGGMEPSQQVPVVPGTVDDGASQTMFTITGAAAAGGAILVGIALWLWRRRRHEARLRKVVTKDLSVEDLFPSVSGVQLALDFRRVAQTMRKRRYEESTELDAEATIEMAASCGGYLVPVYRQRARTPEYTFMIDQTTSSDVQAKVFERAATELAQYGVDVDVFFFDRDPRVCWREGRAKERFRFESVASACSTRRLVMIGDGEHLADQRTGRAARWLEGFFGSFLDVAVLTPRPVLQWDQHEMFLASSGAIVLPATAAGIAAYAGREEPGAHTQMPRSFSIGPAFLEDDDMAWVSPAEPPRAAVRQLLAGLQLSLGDTGIRWLAAAAVYPGVEWSVILLLGRELHIPNFEENLLALARLPWFRRGQMPDWLRIRLLAMLDPETERQVRAVLFQMFEDAVFRESGDATLRIGRYRNLANVLPEGSELAEHVIVDFMSGRKPSALHLSLPQRFVLRMQRFMERPRFAPLPRLFTSISVRLNVLLVAAVASALGMVSLYVMISWMGSRLLAIFSIIVVGVLALDLGVFSRKPHEIKFREALTWTAVWISLSMIFNAWIYFEFGSQKALEFLTGYLIEEALSVNNILVFVILLASFAVPKIYQHRVLFWGVIGAIVMRTIFIGLGIALISRFPWVMYVFGGILIITSIRLLMRDDDHEPHPEKNPIYKLARRVMPAVSEYHGGSFTILKDGTRFATPLLLVLIAIEATDVVFAVDSIPAVFAITTDPFIVYTSNIFAILGLRSMYFLLAGVIDKARYLKIGLALILLFVGGKIVIADWYKVPIVASLVAITGILAIAVIASILWPKSPEIEPADLERELPED